MSEHSSIEWTDTTWNPVTGCTKVSPGCAHCYAETFAERFRGVPGHPFEQGFDLKLWPERLSLPLSWKKPRRVFVNSMSDLFHEDVPFEFIDRVFAVMALSYYVAKCYRRECEHEGFECRDLLGEPVKHTFQVLTKRPERMREYMTEPGRREAVIEAAASVWSFTPGALDDITWPLPNVWLGTSTENQHWLDIRVPELLATPAAVRFLSCEPLLGPLLLRKGVYQVGDQILGSSLDGIDWVIVGGESGPKARSMDVGWARSIVEQCRAAGVACFVKQLGAKPYQTTQRVAGIGVYPSARAARTYHEEPVLMRLKSRKGGEMEEWPEDLRVREMPVLASSSHETGGFTHISSAGAS